MEPVFTTLAQKVATPHTAVLIIDMQNGFCTEGAFGGAGRDMSAIRSMIPRLQQFIDKARKKNVPLVFVHVVRGESQVSGAMRELWQRNHWSTPSMERGTKGADFIPELLPKKDEITLEKTRYSAFVNTDLDAQLRIMGIKTIIVTGVGTSVCVETTARHGFMLDYYVVVPNDLVGGSDKKLDDNALLNLNEHFATVLPSAEILQVWKATP